MKKALALAVGAAIIIGMTYAALSLSAAGKDKVNVCHVEGNGSAHVIRISENAVAKHLAHGDSLDGTDGLEPGDTCEVTDSAGVEK